MDHIRHITKEEECIGKYYTKRTAQRIAKEETRTTGRKHTVFLTHYQPADSGPISCWTIIVISNNKVRF
jgi:hypothetical protein